MEIHIYRHSVKTITCDGTLRIDGSRICDTAENTLFRIPAGTYDVVLRHDKTFARKVPTLIPRQENGRKTAAAVLAIGNGIFNCRDGRIILGTYIVPGCLKCSREPFMLLYDRINNSQRRGNTVTLFISEAP